ncbi:MAG: hypothetical protein AAGB27_11160 [Pseudomonadota bacterium]
MAKIHEVKGYVVVLDKIIHITRVFEAKNDEGAQFNIQLLGDSKLQLKFPDRAAATLERDLLIKALSE